MDSEPRPLHTPKLQDLSHAWRPSSAGYRVLCMDKDRTQRFTGGVRMECLRVGTGVSEPVRTASQLLLLLAQGVSGSHQLTPITFEAGTQVRGS